MSTASLLDAGRKGEGITFALADVEPAKEALPSVNTRQAVEQYLGCSVEACSDYFDDCVADIATNPLITAVQLAYGQHRPLILSPDMVWLTVLQGLTDHLQVTGELYADQVLEAGHDRQRYVVIDADTFPIGSLESPWEDVVSAATCSAATEFSGPFVDLFSQTFSTTTKADDMAQRITFLATAKKFVQFLDREMICGIPEITLEGTPDDWERIRDLIEQFKPYDLEWWLSELRPICDEFANAAKGVINRSHWDSIYSSQPTGCGTAEWVTGWIGKLFPYEGRQGHPSSRNPLLEFNSLDSAPNISKFPVGIREVALRSKRNTTVRLVGGFVGISQSADTKALRPKLGWCVCRQTSFEALLDAIADSDRCKSTPSKKAMNGFLSSKLKQYYACFESLTIFGSEGETLCRFHTPDQLIASYKTHGSRRRFFSPIAELSDGGFIGVKHLLAPVGDDIEQSLGFFLGDDEWSSTCELISGDFEQVLGWIFNKAGKPMREAPGFVPIATVDLARTPDHNPAHAIIDLLRSQDSPYWPQDRLSL